MGEGSKYYLPEPKKILALADHIIGKGLRMLNEEAEDCLTATQVAKTFNGLRFLNSKLGYPNF